MLILKAMMMNGDIIMPGIFSRREHALIFSQLLINLIYCNNLSQKSYVT